MSRVKIEQSPHSWIRLTWKGKGRQVRGTSSRQVSSKSSSSTWLIWWQSTNFRAHTMAEESRLTIHAKTLRKPWFGRRQILQLGGLETRRSRWPSWIRYWWNEVLRSGRLCIEISSESLPSPHRRDRKKLMEKSKLVRSKSWGQIRQDKSIWKLMSIILSIRRALHSRLLQGLGQVWAQRTQTLLISQETAIRTRINLVMPPINPTTHSMSTKSEGMTSEEWLSMLKSLSRSKRRKSETDQWLLKRRRSTRRLKVSNFKISPCLRNQFDDQMAGW